MEREIELRGGEESKFTNRNHRLLRTRNRQIEDRLDFNGDRIQLANKTNVGKLLTRRLYFRIIHYQKGESSMKNTAEKVTKLLIGEKVKRLRTTQALSQEKLAEKADVDVKTIQRLEKGDGARDDTLLRVAEVFKVPVTEFTMLNLDNGRFTEEEYERKIALLDVKCVCKNTPPN